MRELIFTKHAKERLKDRFPGFKETDLARLFQDADKYYSSGGVDYYRSRAYEYIVRQNGKTFVLITFYKF